MNLLILSAMDQIVSLFFFFKGLFGIKITYEDLYTIKQKKKKKKNEMYY